MRGLCERFVSPGLASSEVSIKGSGSNGRGKSFSSTCSEPSNGGSSDLLPVRPLQHLHNDHRHRRHPCLRLCYSSTTSNSLERHLQHRSPPAPSSPHCNPFIETDTVSSSDPTLTRSEPPVRRLHIRALSSAWTLLHRLPRSSPLQQPQHLQYSNADNPLCLSSFHGLHNFERHHHLLPQFGLSGKVSTKADVYSYGVLLVETFTRKKPTDAMFSGDFSLTKWVSRALPDAVLEVVDEYLLDDYGSNSYIGQQDALRLVTRNELLVSILQVGLLCSRESPLKRADMRQVLADLKKIRKKLNFLETANMA